MLQETGIVVKVESDALWVETLQKSACNSCSAQKGCGQHALGKALANATIIRVMLDGLPSSSFHIDQQVVIGIPEDVVVKWSLLIYLIPILLLVVFAAISNFVISSEALSALAGLAGLLLGGVCVRWFSQKSLKDPRLQPVLLAS